MKEIQTMNFTKNVGGIDRILRIVIGAALIAGMFLFPSVLNPWGIIGVVPLATGLLRWCPVYLPLGIKTCEKD
jgi:hypothetical protein